MTEHSVSSCWYLCVFFRFRTFAGFYDCVIGNGEACARQGLPVPENSQAYLNQIAGERANLPLYCGGHTQSMDM